MTRLDARALNRATLARQFLLARADADALDVVTHLGGLQAQEPQEPYTGMWSRVAGFDPHGFSDLLTARRVVRTHLMRRTVHLVTAADAVAWRTRHDAMLLQRLLGVYRGELAGVDLDALAAAARDVLATGPCTLPEAGRALAARWPDVPPRVLGETASVLVPLVQVPPRDTPAPVRFLPAFDNAILGYDDRTRIVDDAHRGLSVAGERAVLVDGRVAATWTVTDGVVTVAPLRRLTRADRTAVAEEGRALAGFLSGGASHRVRVGASPRWRRHRVTIIASDPDAAPGRVDRVSTVLTGSRAAALARVFRIVAIAEACSWVGLLIGMAFKYLLVFDDVGVRVFGPIHGALFVAYVVITLVTARAFRWRAGTTVLALAASIPPAMTLWFERRAVRRRQLG
ncbi:hypothetical protein GCM10023200_50680 [Actinomycetospora chlora]|uniref:DUF3817 domain-containing protein n=1 Tax=Actinomycetospora chlora TaxID=663608 RepID=A0ABP9C988_9PSEU